MNTSPEYRQIFAEYEQIPLGDGADVLGKISQFIRRFVAVTDSQAVVLSLWVAHTHCFVAADCTPYMAITSAEKQSGKTRLLEVLETLVANPWMTGQVTAAVLARKIGDDLPPTLLLDESDAAFKGEKEYVEALRGILNTGYRKGGKYSRCVGQGTKMEVRDFSSFCPKAIAGIGKLPDTIADRSIPIRLKRAARIEKVLRFRRREVLPEADQLRDGLLAWCTSLDDTIQFARPQLPAELSDRKQDVAEPLLAIADAAGGNWPTVARGALVELCAEARSLEDSNGIRLLADIRDIFNDRDVNRIPSSELAAGLAGIETSPWAEWSNGRPISTNKLAHLLSRFGITPANIRQPGGKVPKGYQKDDFADAWARYLPTDAPESPNTPSLERYTATTRINIGDSADFQPATSQTRSVGENGKIPNKNAPCSGVAVPESPLQGRTYLQDASGPGVTCQDCGDHFGTLPGWRSHILGRRCTTTVEASD